MASILMDRKARLYPFLTGDAYKEDMYEAKIIRPGGDSAGHGAAAAAEGLAALSWRASAARLAVAREYRQVLTKGAQDGCGSFNLPSARHLAASGKGKHGINLVALANGKTADGKNFADCSDADTGDRGR